MRRKLLTCLVWFLAVALFLIYLVFNQRNDASNFEKIVSKSEREIRNTESAVPNAETAEPQNVPTTKASLSNSSTSEVQLEEHLTTIENLKKEINSLKRKEKHLKNLARRLASKLKGKESERLPKLDPHIPWVFAITPTYARFTQKADLVRLSQTLLHVTNLHWIIVEDSTYRTDLISRLLVETGLSFTHLNFRTPVEMQRKKREPRRKHHRGVGQRNLALSWLRENIDAEKTPGVVYFMDDDNTYHVKIFDEMRWTKGVSVWPVGLTGGARWAGPIVKDGKVDGFHTNWAPSRSFPLDMAAFAINLKLLVIERPWVAFNSTVKRGFLEPSLLEQLTTKADLEPLAENCTKVLVWHTRTEVPKASITGEKELIKAGHPSDLTIET